VAASEHTVAIAIISLVVIVGGYLLLAGLFYVMVYRPRRDERRAQELDSEREREAGAAPNGDDQSHG
jgi:hypothetical protein